MNRLSVDMTLTELKYLIAVADEQHFGRAAERSFVSQPSLSAAIKNVEQELGVRVFERSKRGVELTEVGAEIVAQARRTLDEAARIKTVAKQGKGRHRLAARRHPYDRAVSCCRSSSSRCASSLPRCRSTSKRT